MSKEEALNAARRLVQEAVDVAGKAGISTAAVVAPYCAESDAAQDDCDGLGSKNLVWGGVPGVIDDSTEWLFEMPEPDDDPEQKPAFLVTQSTADLVGQDFERYEPSLKRMAESWQEEQESVLSETKNDKA